MPLFKAGEKCQGQIKVAAEKESFSQKCTQVLEELHAEAVNQIQKRKRNKSPEETPEQQDYANVRPQRSEQPQYSEEYAAPPAPVYRQAQTIPEFTYGTEWQDMNFDQTAPGGGILGSME